MMKHARETIIVIDSTKFSRKAFCICFPVEDVNTIVTDCGASKDVIEKLKKQRCKRYCGLTYHEQEFPLLYRCWDELPLHDDD